MDTRKSTQEALEALLGARLRLEDARSAMPTLPGLYAIHADDSAWQELDLVQESERQPLYVGKAERSLNGRDVRTHFASGMTGSSTVRRSLAALLADMLSLQAVPRNLVKPDNSANFGLETSGDERLSGWMEEHLSLAFWVKDTDETLATIEAEVLSELLPPLNVQKVGGGRKRLREARQRMAQGARRWSPHD